MEEKNKEIREELQIIAKVNVFLEQRSSKAFQELLDKMVKYIENGGDPEKLNNLLSK
jgi:hypothetical protein